MQKLLLSLMACSVAATPIITLTSYKVSENFRNYNRNENEVINHYNKILELINSDVKDFEILYSEYEKVSHFIFEIINEDIFHQYNGISDRLKDVLINISVNNEYQLNLINKTSNEIESVRLEWLNQIDTNQAYNSFVNITKQTRENGAKLFYAYNQASSKYMLNDMEKYQPIRIDYAKNHAELPSLVNQINLLKQKMESINDAKELQGMVGAIYQNWIDRAEKLIGKFENKNVWDFLDGDKLANYFNEKLQNFLEPVLKNFIDDMTGGNETEGLYKKIYEQVKNWIVNRTFDETGELAKFVTDALIEKGEDSPGYGDNSVLSNEELVEISNKEIERIWSEQENQLVGYDEESKLEKKLGIVKKVLGEVYKIDDIFFGNLHNSAKEFHDFVNRDLPSLSTSVKEMFESKGIHVVSDFEKEMLEALDISSKIAENIIGIFGGKELQMFTSIAFSVVDEVKKWATTFETLKTARKSIEALKKVKEIVTAWPKDIPTNGEEIEKEISEKNLEAQKLEVLIKEQEKQLANSKFDYYKDNLELWNNQFGPYSDYLNIDDLSKQRWIDPEVNLNPFKYFEKMKQTHNELFELITLYYTKITNDSNSPNVLGDKYIEVIKEFETQTNIDKIINQHAEDFK